jgi:hypothetical protein
LLWEQVPVGANALEHIAGGQVERAAILPRATMPDSAAALVSLAVAEAVEQVALVRARYPVIRDRQ